MGTDHVSMRPRLPATIVVLSLISGWLLWVFAALAALKLRPANDDYWIIAESGASFFEQAGFWWNNWSGNVVGTFSNYLFVGLPGVFLPWPFTSSIAFLLAGLGVAAVFLVLLKRGAGVQDLNWKRCIILSPPVAVLWITYLWLGVSAPTSERSRLVFGLTHWQNLNAGYIILPSMVVIGVAFLLTSTWVRSPLGITTSFVAGILVGLSGEPTAVTTALVVIVLLLWPWIALSEFRFRVRDHFCSAALVLGVAVGLSTSLHSPGSAKRMAFIDSYQAGPLIDVSQFGQVAWQTTADLKDAYVNWGTLIALLASITLTALLVTRGVSVVSKQAARITALLFLSTLVAALVNCASEVYAGYGYWHRSTLQLLAFVSILLLGVSVGSAKSSPLSYEWMIAASLLMVISGIAVLGALGGLHRTSTDRLTKWDKGSAPIPQVFDDLGGPQEWIDRSWLRVTAIRDTPERATRMPND